MQIKTIVLAENAQGAPEFFWSDLEVSQEQYDEGEHYEMAKKLAADAGYTSPMTAFDEKDQAARELGELHVFLHAQDWPASAPEVQAAIIGTNANGSPEFFWAGFKCAPVEHQPGAVLSGMLLTRADLEAGVHCRIIEEVAAANDYEVDGLGFDKAAPAAAQLPELMAFLAA